MTDEIEQSRSGEEQFRNIVNAAPVALLMIDDFQKIVLINDEIERRFGYSREELVGHSVDLLVPGFSHQESLDHPRNCLAPPTNQSMSVSRNRLALTKDGVEFPVEMRLRFMEHEGRSFMLMAIIDITQWKASQVQLVERTNELVQSMAELTEFSYVVSHDLQEPLRKIVSSCQALVEDHPETLDSATRRWIDYAVDGAQRMQRMVTDLLTLSRVNTKGQPLAPTNAAEALRDVLSNMQLMIGESSAQFILQPLPCVLADESQLNELFENLISNAIKYRGASTPRIEIGIDSSQPIQPDRHIFFVRDHGIGIAPEHFERIFVVFQRLHRRDEYSGTGIGLAVSKKIVKRHGGKIWVESRPGQGSTFYFSLTKSAMALP